MIYNVYYYDVGGFIVESEGWNLLVVQMQMFREVIQGVFWIFIIFQFEVNCWDVFVWVICIDEFIWFQFGDFICQISGNLVRGVLYFGIVFMIEVQEFIVLCNYLICWVGEVDGKSINLIIQVINVEYQFLWQCFFVMLDNLVVVQWSQIEFMV